MAAPYSDWVTLTGTARITRLRLHIQWLQDQVTPEMANRTSRHSTEQIQNQIELLLGKLSELEAEDALGDDSDEAAPLVRMRQAEY